MKKTDITTLRWGLYLLVFSSLLFTACSKYDSNGNGYGNKTGQLQVSLADNPGDFKAVYIDVQDVSVLYSGSGGYGGGYGGDDNWQSLAGVKKGRYNLLSLVNGNDAVLVNASIATGTITQIRLVLGDDNWVVTNTGDSIHLQTPSGQSSGLKLLINMTVNDGVTYNLLLDFDVAKSIHEAGSAGKFVMNPVIRAILDAQGGSVKGVVIPFVVPSAVILLGGADTIASTYTGSGGAYMIKGIAAGTYSLHFISTDPTLAPASLDNVIVTTGQVTVANTVMLSSK